MGDLAENYEQVETEGCLAKARSREIRRIIVAEARETVNSADVRSGRRLVSVGHIVLGNVFETKSVCERNSGGQHQSKRGDERSK